MIYTQSFTSKRNSGTYYLPTYLCPYVLTLWSGILERLLNFDAIQFLSIDGRSNIHAILLYGHWGWVYFALPVPDWTYYCQQIPWSHHDITLLPCSFFKHCLDWTICVSGVEHLSCMCWGLSFIHSFVTKKQTRMKDRFHGHYGVTSWVYSHYQKLGSMNVMKMKWTCFTEDMWVGVDMNHYMLPYKQSLGVVGSTSVWVISVQNWLWHLEWLPSLPCLCWGLQAI